MIPFNPQTPSRRKRINGSYHATKLIFSKLWRSRVKLPETIIVGNDGVIKQWLFWSKAARCLLRKSYDTLNDGQGHDLILEKFTKGHNLEHIDTHPVMHVLAPAGRAIFDGKGLKTCVEDLKMQHDILHDGLKAGGETIRRNQESVDMQDLSNRSIGSFVATKYTEPSLYCVFVAEIIRNPNRPSNMVESRRMGYLQTSFECRCVEHNSAYEVIDSNEAFTAWKTLTSPVQSKEVRPTYVHRSKSGTTETKKSDYEIFIEFHQSKQKRQVPENVKQLIERDAEDIFSWISQQHGMWITHIEVEYMVEATTQANPSDMYAVRDKHKGRCYLKAVNFVEYVKCATSRPDAQGGVPTVLPMMKRSSSGNASGSSRNGRNKTSRPQSANIRRSTTLNISQNFLSTKKKTKPNGLTRMVQHASLAASNYEECEDVTEDAPSLQGFGDDLQVEPTPIPRATIRGRILVAEAGPRAWSDLLDLKARRPMARTVQEEDLALELGATGDMLSSTRKANVALIRRVRRENKINTILEDQLNKKTTKLNELGRYKNEVDAKHTEILKEEKTLRKQAMWDAAAAKKQMSQMQLRLDIAEKRLNHHLEMEEIRLEEEKEQNKIKLQTEARERKKMKALEQLESALNIHHTFDKHHNQGRKGKSKGKSPGKGSKLTRSGTVPNLLKTSSSENVKINDSSHITENPEIMEQISRLRIAITKKDTQFGTKLGILNDLFSALDLVGDEPGDGAILKEDFLIAMEHVGLKGKKEKLEKLVDALDVDGDGDVSFVELCDGLMRRMQDAKSKYMETLKRQQKEKQKKLDARKKKKGGGRRSTMQ